MTFKKGWFSKKISSSDGYSIEFESRTVIVYRDKTNHVFVSVEMLAPKNAWALFPNDMWIDAGRRKPLTDGNIRKQIVSRIQAIFSHYGWRLDIM